jgi:hypothetical protein
MRLADFKEWVRVQFWLDPWDKDSSGHVRDNNGCN